MSTPSSADSRSPLLAAAMKRKKRQNDLTNVWRRLEFDSEVDCCTPLPSWESKENVTVTVHRRLDFDSAVLAPPRKIKKKVAETVGRKLDFDSANASTPPPRIGSFALRKISPPAFPTVMWNKRAMKSYFNDLASINMRLR